MDIEKKIKVRIRKLLALSASPNESEAASALMKAKTLLSRYGLEITDLSDDKDGLIKEISIEQKKHLAPWEEKLLECILKATYTEILKIYEDGKESIRIIGRKTNIISAQILFDYLKKTIEMRADLFQESISDLESFRLGIVESLKKKFEEKMNLTGNIRHSMAMIILTEKERKKENRRYIEKIYGNPGVSDNWYGVDPNSYGLGKAIGKKISIDQQIEQ